MPFTPFHFGPGLALRSLAGEWFSFTVFCFVQVLIDLEPAWYMLQGEAEIHRFFHTYLGATLAGVVAVFAGRPVCRWLLRLWNSRLSSAQARWLGVPETISWTAATTGALIGAWSHVFLDSFMHADMEPYSPLGAGNGLLFLIHVDTLYLACAAAGALGLGILLWRRRWRSS
ncbi:MAG: DUF4184 family protein [Pseudomonadota bacterium]